MSRNMFKGRSAICRCKIEEANTTSERGDTPTLQKLIPTEQFSPWTFPEHHKKM